jgi:hypothetical protein
LEAELEEKIFRYKLAIKDRLHLEWCWQAELGKGGMECTILAHICTDSSALNVQNKRHLHWKETKTISVMNNDAGFVATTHNLLLKSDPSRTDHHAYKLKMASILASPQAARKKRFIKLDLGSVGTSFTTGANPFQDSQTAGCIIQHNSELDQGSH